MYYSSKYFKTTLVHPLSSRVFQWYQEHSAEHCSPNMTNHQNKQTTFVINRRYYFYYDMFKKEQKYDTLKCCIFNYKILKGLVSHLWNNSNKDEWHTKPPPHSWKFYPAVNDIPFSLSQQSVIAQDKFIAFQVNKKHKIKENVAPLSLH